MQDRQACRQPHSFIAVSVFCGKLLCINKYLPFRVLISHNLAKTVNFLSTEALYNLILFLFVQYSIFRPVSLQKSEHNFRLWLMVDYHYDMIILLLCLNIFSFKWSSHQVSKLPSKLHLQLVRLSHVPRYRFPHIKYDHKIRNLNFPRFTLLFWSSEICLSTSKAHCLYS